MPLLPLDFRDLGLPGSCPGPIRLNSGRIVADGEVHPALRSAALRTDFRTAVGAVPEAFTISTRVYEFSLRGDDDVIVEALENRWPLIIRRAGEVILNFDLFATQHFRFEDSKRPIYTYIPGFNIQKVPEGMRRCASNLVQQLRAPAATVGDIIEGYRRLPLTGFEVVQVLLNIALSGSSRSSTQIFQWPGGKRAAFISLHDVDSGGFLRRKEQDPLLRIEQKHNIRSTWFVPTAIGRNPESVRFLIEAGQEVGWHGHAHDHRLPFAPYADRRVRLLRDSYLGSPDRYPLGMRTPKLLKSHHLYELLAESCPPLRYDTSFLQGILPYYLWLNGRRSRLLEIPTTVPADIRVHNQLRGVSRTGKFEAILNAQIARSERLIEIGGIMSIVTHPELHLTERPEMLEVYDRYLAFVRGRSDIWFVTAGELYNFWTRKDGQTVLNKSS